MILLVIVLLTGERSSIPVVAQHYEGAKASCISIAENLMAIDDQISEAFCIDINPQPKVDEAKA
jgi:hypothetical protein